MNRMSVLAIAVAAAIASLVLTTPAAWAKSGPGGVTQVSRHGLYETVVTCPRWAWPAGGIQPLLAAPAVPKQTKGPKVSGTVRTTGSAHYDPLVTCSVTFLKDPPSGPRHRSATARSCGHKGRMVLGCCGTRRSVHGHMHLCCADLQGATVLMPTCVVLNTGFGGMARQVAGHSPAASRGTPRRQRR